jgi:DNA-binding HxlR family transcriptional regulator
MVEYRGWDDYVESKRRNEQYKQIKEEWKDSVNDYFGGKRHKTYCGHSYYKLPEVNENESKILATEDYVNQKIAELQIQIRSLNNDIYTIHNRLNNNVGCSHNGLKKHLKPLMEQNVIGRIEALEEWRNKEYSFKRLEIVKELSDRINKLEEWKDSTFGTEPLPPKTTHVIRIDKQVWENIKHYAKNVDYLKYHLDSIKYLLDSIKKADPEFCPND